jgi:hypothetical protein
MVLARLMELIDEMYGVMIGHASSARRRMTMA